MMVVARSLKRTRIFTVVHPLNSRKLKRAFSIAGSTSIDWAGMIERKSLVANVR